MDTRSNGWKLKDILMVCIVGVLFSLLFLAANYLGTALTAALTPFGLGALGYEPIYGIYFMAASFALYVIQKKGVGIVAEVLAAAIEMLLGSMFGPMVFVTGLIQGVGIELGFILTGYKRFGWSSLLLGSVIVSICSITWEYFSYGYSGYSIGILATMLIIRTISSIVFNTVFTKLLADGLAKAGVLRSYALGMRQDAPEEL